MTRGSAALITGITATTVLALILGAVHLLSRSYYHLSLYADLKQLLAQAEDPTKVLENPRYAQMLSSMAGNRDKALEVLKLLSERKFYKALKIAKSGPISQGRYPL